MAKTSLTYSTSHPHPHLHRASLSVENVEIKGRASPEGCLSLITTSLGSRLLDNRFIQGS